MNNTGCAASKEIMIAHSNSENMIIQFIEPSPPEVIGLVTY